MKVIGFVENIVYFPFIPKWILLEDKSVINKDRHIVDQNPLLFTNTTGDLPDDHWLMVHEGNQIEVFELQNEIEFRAKQAERCIIESNQIKNDPIRRVMLIRAAAHLIELDMGSLIKKLSMVRHEHESYADILQRLKAEDTR